MAASRFERWRRLTRPAQFKAVFDGALRLGDRQFSILCLPNGLTHPRLGLVIARKYLHKATDRNRLKRQIRESFRHRQREFPGVDVVVLLRADVSQQTNKQLQEQLQRQWQQVVKRCVPS